MNNQTLGILNEDEVHVIHVRVKVVTMNLLKISPRLQSSYLNMSTITF